jgi:hypothetical protein
VKDRDLAITVFPYQFGKNPLSEYIKRSRRPAFGRSDSNAWPYCFRWRHELFLLDLHLIGAAAIRSVPLGRRHGPAWQQLVLAEAEEPDTPITLCWQPWQLTSIMCAQ